MSLRTTILIVGTFLFAALISCEKDSTAEVVQLPTEIRESNPPDSVLREYIWSIGIYGGITPFNLFNINNSLNPVLTADDVTDIKAKFVADPFIIKKDSTFYMFFEVMDSRKFRGVVSCATSSDGFYWNYERIVLAEPFHLSYPHVFEFNNQYYMIPESHIDSSVRLYKATNFPFEWNYEGNLLEGKDFIDPTIIFYNNKWWLFVSDVSSSRLFLYYSNNLEKGWKLHPKSPIVAGSIHVSRPGGRIFNDGNNIYRFAQDDAPFYGIQVWAYKILTINETEYIEEPVPNGPVVKWGNSSWNCNGMHQVDIFLENEGFYYGVVDGYY